MQFHELGQIVVVQRTRLSQIASRIKPVVPDLSRGRALLEEKHNRLYARALKRASGQIEHCVKIAAFQQGRP